MSEAVLRGAHKPTNWLVPAQFLVHQGLRFVFYDVLFFIIFIYYRKTTQHLMVTIYMENTYWFMKKKINVEY